MSGNQVVSVFLPALLSFGQRTRAHYAAFPDIRRRATPPRRMGGGQRSAFSIAKLEKQEVADQLGRGSAAGWFPFFEATDMLTVAGRIGKSVLR